jgi:ABC-type sugar transport system ATPase subunit
VNVLEGRAGVAAVARAYGERIADGRLSVGIRPQDVALVSPAGALVATVDIVEPLGHATIVHVRTGDEARVVVVAPGGPGARPGDTVGLRFDAGRLHVFAPDGRRLEG